MMSTEVVQWRQIFREEEDEVTDEHRYLANISLAVDYLTFEVRHIMTKDPPKYTKTVDDFLLKRVKIEKKEEKKELTPEEKKAAKKKAATAAKMKYLPRFGITKAANKK